MNKTTATQQTNTSTFTTSAGRLLQRKCACGNLTMAGGECAECAKKTTGLQRKLTIGASNDPLELEADRVADQVVAKNAAPLPASNLVSGQLQREEAPKEKTNEEKYQEGLEKLGEAFLETPLGKQLLEKIKQDALVKGAITLGKDIISTWPGKIYTGEAAIITVAALAATHKELPAQIPEIPLDILMPGLSVKLTYKGPVDKPTEAMITFKFTEQPSKDGADKKTISESDKYRAETARMAADQNKFQAGLRYPPGSPEDLQQKAQQEAIRKVVQKNSGDPIIGAAGKKYPMFATPQPKNGLQLTMPKPPFGTQPPSLLGDQFKLRPLGEQKKKLDELPLQRKLSIGASNDPLEQEADRVADQVMAAPRHSAINAMAPRIQRFTGQASGGANAAPDSVDRVLAGSGRPLEPALRQDMEQRFGHDFSQVKVHTGSAAEQSAREVNAHAYTVGKNIVFGVGQFAPGMHEGRRLIAHELAHTIQQGTSETLRRRTDYDIIGLNPNAASEPFSIYFDFGSATLAAGEQAKIASLARPAGRSLTLFGYASEEGAAAARTAMTGRRLSAVGSALRAAGHTGPQTLKPDIVRGEGQINYRDMRVVEVVPTPVVGPAVPAHGSGACNPAEPCGTAFALAYPVAVAQLSAATTAVTTRTAAATTQLTRLFPGVPTAQVLTGLNGLKNELIHMVTHQQCHNDCDPGCDRDGYADPTTRTMTLCPGFLHGTSIPENALLLLHEGLHMVPGLTTTDTAYRRSRFIDFIPGAQAATNTDSFVLLIVRLSGSAAPGPPADPVGSLAPADQTAARRALTYVEQWLLTCDWDTTQLYDSIKANKGRPGGWDPAHNYHAGTQHVIGWIFDLTDPGAAPPYTNAPTQSDQEKVAGIHDRYNRFMRTVWAREITVTTNAAGSDVWAANLGNAVVVTPAFFGLGAADQVLRLIELMAASLPPSDVPVARQRHYATAAQQLWWHSGRFGP